MDSQDDRYFSTGRYSTRPQGGYSNQWNSRRPESNSGYSRATAAGPYVPTQPAYAPSDPRYWSHLANSKVDSNRYGNRSRSPKTTGLPLAKKERIDDTPPAAEVSLDDAFKQITDWAEEAHPALRKQMLEWVQTNKKNIIAEVV